MKPYINNYSDIMELLDEQVATVPWDEFYRERKKQAPFIVQNTMPDENLVELLKKHDIKLAVEFGCGEGRNAIYMANCGIDVTAYDISDVAIENAAKIANKSDAKVNFICENVLNTDISTQFDLVYDSGMFHHLSPHRRITYIELLQKILKPNGLFALTCFASGENAGDEMNDWDYYKQKFNAGLAFTEERLRELFSPYFNVIEIRKYRNGVPNTIQGLQFMWVCTFQKR